MQTKGLQEELTREQQVLSDALQRRKALLGEVQALETAKREYSGDLERLEASLRDTRRTHQEELHDLQERLVFSHTTRLNAPCPDEASV